MVPATEPILATLRKLIRVVVISASLTDLFFLLECLNRVGYTVAGASPCNQREDHKLARSPLPIVTVVAAYTISFHVRALQHK